MSYNYKYYKVQVVSCEYKKYSDFGDLNAYQKAFKQGCKIFDLTLSFPKEEQYSLTYLPTKFVCAKLAETYRKRDYLKHFLLKITDCSRENGETLVWLQFAKQHKYKKDIFELLCIKRRDNKIIKIHV